ncbi:hypothetical protein FA95DRAFT_1641654, partial [Auriscalpium vulgare]
FFYRPVQRKKAVKVAAGGKRVKRGRAPAAGTNTSDTTDIIVQQGTGTDDVDLTEPERELLAEEGADNDGADGGGEVDPAKAAHDEAAVRSVKGQALLEAQAEHGIFLSAKELSVALGLFPKVAGLARRLHDSPTMQEKFDRLVDAQRGAHDQKRRLDRRVPTRWNSDYACLAAHVQFKSEVRQLTTEDGLADYALTPEQWSLAEKLKEVLEIFQDVTDLFSMAEVPLVHEVVPMLEDLELRLTYVRGEAIFPNVV